MPSNNIFEQMKSEVYKIRRYARVLQKVGCIRKVGDMLIDVTDMVLSEYVEGSLNWYFRTRRFMRAFENNFWDLPAFVIWYEAKKRTDEELMHYLGLTDIRIVQTLQMDETDEAASTIRTVQSVRRMVNDNRATDSDTDSGSTWEGDVESLRSWLTDGQFPQHMND